MHSSFLGNNCQSRIPGYFLKHLFPIHQNKHAMVRERKKDANEVLRSVAIAPERL